MKHIPTHILVRELVKRFDDFVDYGVDDFSSAMSKYDEVMLSDTHTYLHRMQQAYVEIVMERVLESLGNQGD